MKLVFRPGGTAWLLAHELRLNLRSAMAKGGSGRRMLIVFGVLFVVMGVAGGVPAALALRHVDAPLNMLAAVLLGLVLVVIWSLMLSSTLSSAASALYLRGDLDLLLSSPISAERVLAVRAVGMTLSAMAIVVALVTPFLIPLAVLGDHWRWLAAYGVLAAMSVAATAVGLVLALAMFAVLGPKRTRVAAQVMAALIGASLAILGQLRNFAPQTFSKGAKALMALADPRAPATGPLSWPARAMVGEPLPLLGLMLGAVGLLTVVVWGLGRRFAANAAAAQVGSGPGRARAGATGRFRGGLFRAMMIKELRLLRRDPGLMSLVLLRFFYLVPLVFLLVKKANSGSALAPVAGAVAFMAGQIASNLAWITLSAEDAPDLLGSGPVGGREVRRAKLAAALTPVAVLLVVPIGVLAWFSPLAAAATTLGAIGGSVSLGLINLWFEKPGKRSDIRRRRSGSWEVGLLEVIVGALWGVATGLAAAKLLLWSLLPLIAALIIVSVARRSDDADGYVMRPVKA